MKTPLLFFAMLLFGEISGQTSVGIRTAVLFNTLHDCYEDGPSNQDKAAGVYVHFSWPLKNTALHLQGELGFSRRNSRMVSAGVSHAFYREFRFKQVESALLLKWELPFGKYPRIMCFVGLAGGYALGGREHITGGSVGPTSVDEYRDVVFNGINLKRLQIGPLLGFDLSLPLWKGELLTDARFAWYPEGGIAGCDNPHERRLSLSLGYRWWM